MQQIRKCPNFVRALAGIASVLFAPPVPAAHVMQSIPLHSPDGGFVAAPSFVRDEGSVYLAGGFSGAVDFNPNGAPSVHTSTCPTTMGCSFVARYDETMQLAWIDVFYATGDAADQRLIARTGGGVYLLLDFAADFAYRPNETEPVYHAAETNDIAVVALDGNGAFAGSAQVGALGANVLDHSRPFEAAPGIVDFAWTHQGDPSVDPGRQGFIARADTLTGIASVPSIVMAADDGQSFVRIRDQRLDASGRYVCGEYGGTIDFDALHAHRSVTAGAIVWDAFIARYDNAGALVWLSTVTADYIAECYGLSIASDGTLWVGGDFGGAGEVSDDVNPASVPLESWGGIDALVLAYDADGALISNAHLGGSDAVYTEVYLDRIEVAADDSLVMTGQFGGTILRGFAGALNAQSMSDDRDGFVLVAAPDFSTRYFGHIGYVGGYTFEPTLQLPAPMQFETTVQMSTPTADNALLNYALPPEQALLHNDGRSASAYVRYDLDALLVSGFEPAP